MFINLDSMHSEIYGYVVLLNRFVLDSELELVLDRHLFNFLIYRF